MRTERDTQVTHGDLDHGVRVHIFEYQEANIQYSNMNILFLLYKYIRYLYLVNIYITNIFVFIFGQKFDIRVTQLCRSQNKQPCNSSIYKISYFTENAFMLKLNSKTVFVLLHPPQLDLMAGSVSNVFKLKTSPTVAWTAFYH